MGLRCLLGHDFGDPETEREREEKGEEMVVTFRTVKTCARCGETQVVSENKEVTSIPETIAGADDAAPDTDVADTDDAVTTDAVTAADDDGELVDAAEPDDADADTADDPTDVEEPSHPRVGDDEKFEPPQSAEEDDGIILDDEDDEDPPARKPGEWPDASDVGRGDDDRMPTLEEVEGEGGDETDDTDDTDVHEPTPWPDQHGEDEGFAAELDDGEAVDVDFGNRLAPEMEDTEEGYDAEFIGNAADAADTTGGQSSSGGFTRAETLTREEANDLPTEYYCPECQMTRPANHSSMRAGDICPECHHGYVTERER